MSESFRAVFFVCVAVIAIAGSPAAGSPAGTEAGDAVNYEQTLVQQVYQRSSAEAAKAQLAASEAHEPDVQELASRVLALHNELNSQWVSTAERLQFNLPKALTDADQQVLERLETLQMQAFDATFLRSVVQGLMRHTNLLDKLAAQATDPDLRAIAGAALPQVDALRQQAHDLRIALVPIDVGPVGASAGSSQPAQMSQGETRDGSGERVNATSTPE